MATDTSDQEQQHRELEEIRRQFAEVGKRIGSAFEPASPDENRERPLAALAPPTAPPDAQPAPPDQQPARPRWLWVVAVALLLVGTGLGYALPRAGSNDPPAPSTARPPVSTQPQPPQPVPSVPQVCLETARRGDEVIAKLTVNDRSRRLAAALKAYTLASQACRQAASP
jgi:hypothetical protein